MSLLMNNIKILRYTRICVFTKKDPTDISGVEFLGGYEKRDLVKLNLVTKHLIYIYL